MIPCAHLRMSVQMRALPSITHWVLCVRSKRRTPPGLTLRSEAAGDGCGNSADTCAAIKKKKLTGGVSFPTLEGITGVFHCSAEVSGHTCVRARARRSGRRERRGGREEESDTCRVVDFNSGSPFLKYSPGLRGCPQWLILGLARALLSQH